MSCILRTTLILATPILSSLGLGFLILQLHNLNLDMHSQMLCTSISTEASYVSTKLSYVTRNVPGGRLVASMSPLSSTLRSQPSQYIPVRYIGIGPVSLTQNALRGYGREVRQLQIITCGVLSEKSLYLSTPSMGLSL